MARLATTGVWIRFELGESCLVRPSASAVYALFGSTSPSMPGDVGGRYTFARLKWIKTIELGQTNDLII